MVVTNSTYDGLCYNVDNIKQQLGNAVDILHFDEAWYAYANFHEFYDGYHAISSSQPARSPHATTFATHSTHKLLAALSQSSHDPRPEQHRRPVGYDAIQRGLHDAYLDVAPTTGHCLLRCCRRDDGAAGRQSAGAGDHRRGAQLPTRHECSQSSRLNGSWWFDVWQPEAILEQPSEDRAQWVLKSKDRWHGFEGLAENHVMVDPIKVTILSPGLSADGSMKELRYSCIGGDEVPLISTDRN